MRGHKTVQVGEFVVGEGQPCFIVFECGATHDGLETAKKLCKAAKDAGADAVKFQILDPDRISGDKKAEITFMTTKGERKETIYGALKRRAMTSEEWKKLKAYCDDIGILFFSTACFPEEIDLLVEMESAAIKITAGDVNHYSLIEYAAKTGLPIILDGRAKYDELERGVQICEESGNENIIIMHCPSGYPAKNTGVNLNTLQALRDIYQYPIGFSDHSPESVMNFAALAKGATVLEKTLTLDKATPQVEHYMSLEPGEAKQFVNDIRAIEEAFGSPRIMFNKKVGMVGRRSVVAKHGIKKGDRIDMEDIDFRRPGDRGIPADEYTSVIGAKAKIDIEELTFITPDMVERP